MAFNEGFNFRLTLAFVTDPADTTANIYSGVGNIPEQYPNDISIAGWTDNADMQERDRNAGNDPRLAGHCRADAGASPYKYRVDLPAAGDYEIRLALGDASYAVGSGGNYWRILDNTTELASLGPFATAAANNFIDASGTNRTHAAWVSSNTPVTYTFATTTFILEIGNAASTDTTCLAHLQIVQLDTTPPPTTAFQGFQSDAFQGPAGYLQNLLRTAFQQDAFQSNAFQIYAKVTAGGDTNVNANSVALTLTPHAATISVDRNVATTSVALTLTPRQATVSVNRNVATTSVALILTPRQATISVDRNVATTSVALTLTPRQASIAVDRNVTTTSVALVLTPHQATVSTTSDINVATNLVTMVLTTYRATIEIVSIIEEESLGGGALYNAKKEQQWKNQKIILIMAEEFLKRVP